ncbi:MAG TPA: hypothetical protein GX707_16660 [Epulopiscium sp.]|nr:hypothetical protein [Candidatus Epulonipiscium sp.]
MDVDSLKKEIRNQMEVNIMLFNSIPTPTREDPSNAKAEPVLKQWRDGSYRLKEMIRELQVLESKKIETERKEDTQVIINGYGEATSREITCSSYKQSQKKLSKEILSFIR